MSFLSRLRSSLEATMHRSRMEREMEDELRFHIESRASELMASGLSPEQAQRQARIEFGGIDRAKEQCREVKGAGWVESLLRDIKYGLRMLRKNPGFSFVAMITLALGIGATTAVFSLVNAVLLRALPYKDPQQLVFVWEPNPRIPGVPLEAWGPFNADFYDWKRQSHSFSSLALFTTDRINFALGGRAVRVIASRITEDFFPLLGVPPELGRALQADDEEQGRAQVAVISHALWQSQFGSDPNVLGRELGLNARSYRVIGVMPAGFSFPHGNESLDTVGKKTDIWIPWAMTPKERASREDDAGTAIARLRPGVSAAQAQAEISAITAQIDPLHPPEFRGSQAAVRPFDLSITGASRRALLIFMGAVTLVLLIVCTNVAGLVLAYASGRTLEMTLRAALGASRLRLIRQMLAESVCLAAIGGAIGVLIAYVAVRLITHINSGNIPRIDEVSVDWRALLFTACVSLSTGILFGVFPAFATSQFNLNDALKSAGRRTIKAGAGLLHRGLMVAQVALTIVLLAGSGLLIRSFIKLQSVDKGFSPSSTVTMNIQLDSRYNSPERQNQFYRALIDRISSVPGVHAAGAINYLPLSGGESLMLLTVEGHPFEKTTFFEERAVTPRYFEGMGIPLLEGRCFSEHDTSSDPRIAIVSRSFAQRYFPGESAIGKRFGHNDELFGTVSNVSWTIVGVVADVRQMSLDAAPPMQVYTPLWSGGVNSVSVVARTSLSENQLAADMRAIVRDLDRNVAVADVRTMNELISDSMAQRRFQTALLTSFGGFALFLSLVGLYAMLAYSVRQKTAEIGIRMALGAQRANVMRMVLKQGTNLALVGLALGVACAWIVTRSISTLLFEVKPLDATTFLIVTLLFFAVALAASYLPARRATRVDPMVALRYE